MEAEESSIDASGGNVSMDESATKLTSLVNYYKNYTTGEELSSGSNPSEPVDTLMSRLTIDPGSVVEPDTDQGQRFSNEKVIPK